MVLLYQIGRKPAEKEKQNIVVAEEGKGRYQNNWLFQIITQRVSCLIFYCFQRDFFFFHFINQLKFFRLTFLCFSGELAAMKNHAIIHTIPIAKIIIKAGRQPNAEGG